MTEKEENWKEKRGRKGVKDRRSKGTEGVSYDDWKEFFFREAKPAHALQPRDLILNRYWQQFRGFLLNCVRTLHWRYILI